MHKHERHRAILGYLGREEFLSVEDAVAMLKSSPATVRRDFNELSESRLADRTRGGLCRARTVLQGMVPFAFRESQFSREKVALARHAASLLSVGDVIFVDGGSTTFQMARFLAKLPVRCITTSIYLARALSETSSGEGAVEVFLTGGYLYPRSGLLIGPQAKASLSQYHANWAFISVAAISEDGIFNSNELVVENEQAMIANADRTVILADHSKLGRRSMCRISGLEAVDVLVTDRAAGIHSDLGLYRGQGIEVIPVDVDGGEIR
jgi:DeoR/GlpR family transcriptional regulator of sugar metabolism